MWVRIPPGSLKNQSKGIYTRRLDSRADNDINPHAPICIGMDYNANINWIVAGQPNGRRLNIIKSFYVKFNRQNNDDLILAVQSAGVTRGRNGFRKDKGGEKLAETEEDLLQHRTDGTDAFDKLYIGSEKFPVYERFPITSSGIL